MGIVSMCARLACLTLVALAVAGCPATPPPEQDTRNEAGPGGPQTIICPGDTRCGQIALVPATGQPEYQSCEVVNEHVVMRCTGNGGGNNGPCPGTGCPTGQEPGRGDHCEIWRRYVELNCPANDGSGPPP